MASRLRNQETLSDPPWKSGVHGSGLQVNKISGMLRMRGSTKCMPRARDRKALAVENLTCGLVRPFENNSCCFVLRDGC